MIDGRNMVMVIGPHKNKATAKAEAEAGAPRTSRPRSSATKEAHPADAPAENTSTKEEKDA